MSIAYKCDDILVVVVGSAAGILPIGEQLSSYGYRYLVAGHSNAQTGSQLDNNFFELNLRCIDEFKLWLRHLDTSTNKLEIIPGPHDLCYQLYIEGSVSLQKMNSSAIELSDDLHNNAKFRQRLMDVAPERCPQIYTTIEQALDSFSSRALIFKPGVAGGGRGIKLLSNSIEIEEIRKFEDPLGEGFIIEEHVEGKHYSVSIWIKDGKLARFHAEREVIDFSRFRVKASMTSNEILNFISDLKIPHDLVDILGEFGFLNGFAHTQIIVDTHGSWKIVETMLRLPGDLYGLSASLFSRFEYHKYYVDSFLGCPETNSSIGVPIFPDKNTYVRTVAEDVSQLIGRNPYVRYFSHSELNAYDQRLIDFYKTNLSENTLEKLLS